MAAEQQPGIPPSQTNPGMPRGPGQSIATSPATPPPVQPGAGGTAGFQPTTGAYAEPMQMPASNVMPPPVFQAPQVQERVVTGPQIDYSQYGPYLQQMEDEQLASRQLEGLLASDSPYMRQAVLSGQRTAAQRGALSSSISAGASQAAAIQAAAPIAFQDAQAYQRIASENATAINNNNLAKLQSATNMATSKLQSLTALASTAMDAESRGKIAALNANAQSAISQMQIQAQREAQEFEAAHQRAMEMLGQQGRMDIARFQQTGAMEQLAFQQEGAMSLEGLRQAGALDLARASNEYALEQIGFRGSIESYVTNQQFRGNFLLQQNANIANIIASIGMSDMDASQQIQAIRNGVNIYNAFSPDVDFDAMFGAPPPPPPPEGEGGG